MNYRHGYHAGNFADVLKHIVLTRLIEYLKRKEKAFRVIDTHAGAGLYALGGGQAARTGEWREGIGRLASAELPPEAAGLIEPYLQAVSAQNASPTLERYPGSPLIARHLARRQDRLSLVELHPEEAALLRPRFAGDVQSRVIELDGWLALGAHLPPKEKRGLVLVDPPFEEQGEFDRIVDRFARAWQRWPGGVYALWYPIKDLAAVSEFRQRLSECGIPKILDIWQTVRAPGAEPSLIGSGIVVVNPNFELQREMEIVLPALDKVLRQSNASKFAADWLAGEGRIA